jgi:hypothetical protein
MPKVTTSIRANCPKCHGEGHVCLGDTHVKTLEAIRKVCESSPWAKVVDIHKACTLSRSRSGTNKAVEFLVAQGLVEMKMDGDKPEWPFKVRVV